jgi:hypothetical protein
LALAFGPPTMASSSTRGSEGDGLVQIDAVPAGLRERLGDAATADFVAVLHHARQDMTTDVIRAVGDRFERRLVEETSKLRVDMVQGFSALRQEIAVGLGGGRQELGSVRLELRQEVAALRQDMAVLRQEMAAMRQEMAAGFASIRQDMADQRFEILKWVFVFWVGQFFAVAGVVAVLVRILRP